MMMINDQMIYLYKVSLDDEMRERKKRVKERLRKYLLKLLRVCSVFQKVKAELNKEPWDTWNAEEKSFEMKCFGESIIPKEQPHCLPIGQKSKYLKHIKLIKSVFFVTAYRVYKLTHNGSQKF